MITVAPHLSISQVFRLLQSAWFGGESVRHSLLAGIKDVPPSRFAEALRLARDIDSPTLRALALAALCNSAPRPTAVDILHEAMGGAQQLEHPRSRLDALAAMNALVQAASLKVFIAREAASLIRSLQAEGLSVDALAAFATLMSEELVSNAESFADHSPDPIYRLRARAYLLGKQSFDIVAENARAALEAVWSIEPELWDSRAKALAAIAPHLPEEHVQSAIRHITTMPGPQPRSTYLRAMLSQSTNIGRAKIHDLLVEVLRTSGAGGRDALLSDIAALAPVMLYIGGASSMSAIGSVIYSVADRWQ